MNKSTSLPVSDFRTFFFFDSDIPGDQPSVFFADFPPQVQHQVSEFVSTEKQKLFLRTKLVKNDWFHWNPSLKYYLPGWNWQDVLLHYSLVLHQLHHLNPSYPSEKYVNEQWMWSQHS